jgi:hypothetical protein
MRKPSIKPFLCFLNELFVHGEHRFDFGKILYDKFDVIGIIANLPGSTFLGWPD